MAEPVKLLFEIDANLKGVKEMPDEAKDALTKLRAAFSTQLGELHFRGLELLDTHIEHITNEIPIVGPLIGELASKVLDLGRNTEGLQELASDITKIGQASGRSNIEVLNFLTSLKSVKDDAQRSDAVLSFLGSNLATTLLPSLEAAATASTLFGNEIIAAAKAAGKSDDEIQQFNASLTTSATRADALSKIVGFLGKESATKLAPAMDAAAASIEKIAAVSNLPVGVIAQFVAEFGKLGTEAEKSAVSAGFFGEAIAEKVEPELKSASAAMTTATADTSLFVAQLGAIVEAIGPVGIAIIGLVVQLTIFAAELLVLVEVGKKAVETFFNLAEGAAEFRAHLKDLSLQTGLSVEFLSSMELAMRSMGGTLDSLVASLLQFQTKLEQSKDPTSDISAVFEKLGVDSDDLETALKQTFIGLAKISDESTQSAIAVQLFGRSAKQLLAVLRDSHGDIDKVIAKAHELGIVVSEEDAEAASKFEAAMAAVQLQFRALTSTDVIPAATSVLEFFSKQLSENRESINFVIGAIGLASKAFSIILIGAIKAAQGELLLITALLRGLVILFPSIVVGIDLLSKALGILGGNLDTTSEKQNAAAAAAEAHKKAHEAARLEAEKRVKAGEQEIDFLDSLVGKTQLSAEENERLEKSYDSLDEATVAHIKSIENETDRIHALVAAKREQLDADKQQALADKARAQFVLDQINDNKRAEASNESVRNVELETSKQIREQAARDFQAGRISREAKLEADKKAAEEERRITVKSLEDKRKIAIEEYQLILLTNKRNAAAKGITQQDKEKETSKASEITKLNEQIILADKKLTDTRKQLSDQFDADEIQAERKHQENLVSLFQQAAQNKIAAIRDELATGESVRRQVQEREINETKIAEKRKSIALLQDEVKQFTVNREMLLDIQKDFSAQDLQLVQDQAEHRINLLIKLGTIEALEAEKRIKIQEDASIRERRANLQRLLSQTNVISEQKAINDKLDALAIEETEVQRQQSLRKQQIIRDERDAVSSLLLQNAEDKFTAITEIENRATEVAKQQADLRITSEETAAKKIAESRKRLLDAQQILIEVEQAAAKTIDNPLARAAREEELLNKLRALKRARVQLEQDTNEQIQDARQKDLQDEARYQDELDRLQSRTRSSVRDAARAIIDNFIGGERRRREIIRQQIQLDVDELGDRNDAENESTRREISIKAERVRFLTEHIADLRRLRQTEKDDFRDANDERDRLLTELDVLHEKEEAEETRHVLAMSVALRMLRSGEFTNREILNQLNIEKGLEDIRHKHRLEALEKRKAELEKKQELDNKEIEELKRVNKEIEDENERHRQKTEQQDSVEKGAKTPDFVKGLFEGLGESPIKKQGDALKELGKIAGDTFRSMAAAVGSLVQQWVLYGTTDPAALRKVVAAALAAFAAQAAVAALMELAYGFAALTPWGALVYGPAILHFKAAAFFAAAAAIAGIAGRAVAGNVFNQGQSAGGGAGGGTQAQTPPPVRAIDITRPNQETAIHVFVHAEPGPGFNQHVINGIVRDVKTNGDMRNLIIDTVGG